MKIDTLMERSPSFKRKIKEAIAEHELNSGAYKVL